MTTSVHARELTQPVRPIQRPDPLEELALVPQQPPAATSSSWRDHVLLLRGCLHKLARQLAPELRIVTASDYPKSAVAGHLDGGTFSGFQQKNWLWNDNELWRSPAVHAPHGRAETDVIRDLQFVYRLEPGNTTGAPVRIHTDLGAEANIGFSRHGSTSNVTLLRQERGLGYVCLSVAGVHGLFNALLPELAVWPLYRAGSELGLFALEPLEEDDVPWVVEYNVIHYNQVSPEMLARWIYTAYKGLRATGVTESTALVSQREKSVPSVCFHYSPRTWATSRNAIGSMPQHNYMELACVPRRGTAEVGIVPAYGEEGLWEVEITKTEALFGDPNMHTPWIEAGSVVSLRRKGLRWLSRLLTTAIAAEFLLLCEEAGLVAPHAEKVSP